MVVSRQNVTEDDKDNAETSALNEQNSNDLVGDTGEYDVTISPFTSESDPTSDNENEEEGRFFFPQSKNSECLPYIEKLKKFKRCHSHMT